jgi:hypothetical protein
LKGWAWTSYGTIAGVRQLYGKYNPGVTIINTNITKAIPGIRGFEVDGDGKCGLAGDA